MFGSDDARDRRASYCSIGVVEGSAFVLIPKPFRVCDFFLILILLRVVVLVADASSPSPPS